MKNVILIGMPGTGKSTVGVILAKRLGYDFIDQDIVIALREERQLSEIIEQDGIDRFLEIEGEVGLGINAERTVIATGGSAVFSDAAMQHFKENGV
ncbi:MAG: AAA family ATPase, partial [Firmicutes bacterium]|nr:AAA family ATPase [Bacillota bacterium]